MRRTLVDVGLLVAGGVAGLCLAIAWASRHAYTEWDRT
jgi:hypothetical protein